MDRNRITGLEMLHWMTNNKKSLEGGFQMTTKSQFLNSLPFSPVPELQALHRF